MPNKVTKMDESGVPKTDLKLPTEQKEMYTDPKMIEVSKLP